MKTLLVLATILMATSAHASVKCKFELRDLTDKPIVVTAETKDDLIVKTANRCFDMYEQAASRRGQRLQDDDQGVTIANACTNVRCS
jgi:hypothetical protein